jgi:hypothetical protein
MARVKQNNQYTGTIVGLIQYTRKGSNELTQAAMKTGYEIIALPITNYLVKWVKKHEGIDVYYTKIRIIH